MRIEPREQLLDLWRSVARASLEEGNWKWGGRLERNSISDAEQLLTILYPAASREFLSVADPSVTPDDVQDALRRLGRETELPRRLIELLIEHVEFYTDEEGPVFSGGSYLWSNEPGKDPTPSQRKLDVVDSFSMAVTLMLSTLAFTRDFRSVARNPATTKRIDYLEEIARRRLTAAMVGLLRSFVVYVFDADSESGEILVRTVNQQHQPARQVLRGLHRDLQRVRASLNEVSIGFASNLETLESRSRLFEVGWTWGVARDAPEVLGIEKDLRQRKGVAEAAPYLYFTVNALDGISDLFSDRTIQLSLLDDEQQRLASALRLRWEAAQRYWSAIATYGEGRGGTRWPLQDIPWRTTDNRESEYFTLMVSSLAIQDRETNTARVLEEDLLRLTETLDELAQRGRITRRTTREDPGVIFHHPGLRLELTGSSDLDGGPTLRWQLSDFSAVMLKNTLRLTALTQDIALRDRLVRFSEQLWEHLFQRRIKRGPGEGLWDDPGQLFGEIPERFEHPSWYITERVVECLTLASQVATKKSPQSGFLETLARDSLSEAESRLSYITLELTSRGTGDLHRGLTQARLDLEHAQRIIFDRPATAHAMASEVLRLLERLDIAGSDAHEGDI
ncbi:SCO2524 family protein [Actinocorallia sp. A-T 12471]|uniref:SCO2524 family protein n=1 Tax=Actinocorallia sp. A-T 12471 TaxID=3089813 RepID=UPI0029D13926|nr:SCO2524 family protein [Actinocorallia sp. A-T 12471]MDX6739815.1 SCO2524 family protein [Actinocorallia sp. A-T 12471]